MKARQDFLRAGGGYKSTRILFTKAYDEYLKYCEIEIGNCMEVIKNKITYGTRLKKHFGEHTPLASITEDMCHAYKATASKRKSDNDKSKCIAPATVDREITNMKQFFKWAKKKRYIAVNPAEDVQKYNIDNRRGNKLTHEQARNLLDYLQADTEMLVWVGLCLEFGDRKKEITSIKYSDIDGNRITIVREKKKTRERTDIELSDRLHEHVQKQIANPVLPKCKRNDKNYRKDYLLKTEACGKRFKRALKECGISEDFWFHDLRHTAASWLNDEGVPVQVISKFLGHSDIRTTMRYIHIDDKEVNAAAALNAKVLWQNNAEKEHEKDGQMEGALMKLNAVNNTEVPCVSLQKDILGRSCSFSHGLETVDGSKKPIRIKDILNLRP